MKSSDCGKEGRKAWSFAPKLGRMLKCITPLLAVSQAKTNSRNNQYTREVYKRKSSPTIGTMQEADGLFVLFASSRFLCLLRFLQFSQFLPFSCF